MAECKINLSEVSSTPYLIALTLSALPASHCMSRSALMAIWRNFSGSPGSHSSRSSMAWRPTLEASMISYSSGWITVAVTTWKRNSNFSAAC
jgi:hypothetical protein